MDEFDEFEFDEYDSDILTDDDGDRHLFGIDDDHDEDELVAILAAEYALEGEITLFGIF